MERPVLHLPDVAELVRHEIVGLRAGRLSEDDRPDERVPAIAPERWQAEERGRDNEADALDRDRTRVEVEAVEPGLRPLQGFAR